MGRFLFGGRNSQPYGNAVKRFKELLLGSEGCIELMFKILDQEAAFHHAEYLVSEPADFS
jgi:hypothetical protein